jgi:2-polyprenyl-6-hydroxyphenyl methylase/3-demethylubiquinone-9 3-methyltransferase
VSGYYSEKLSAERLRRCYDIAPPRVRRYLQSELDFVLGYVRPSDRVLELGCGYGRVLRPLLKRAAVVTGIDSSLESLKLAREELGGESRCHLAVMDAARLAFRRRRFDLVVCIQNGISAFAVDQPTLIREAVRVTRGGGRILFSSYAPEFWSDRLEWFRMQSSEGLVGEIDEQATGDGVIVCKDGFRATTVGPREFRALADELGLPVELHDVNESSLFCEIQKKGTFRF